MYARETPPIWAVPAMTLPSAEIEGALVLV
jgi:hypothetical protein